MKIVPFLVVFLTLIACKKESEQIAPATAEDNTSAEGGTTMDFSINSFGHSISNLPIEDEIKFGSGNSFFRENWVLEPSTTTSRDGLGPMFNSVSCSGCHFKDGRGEPPAEGQFLASMLLRLSVPGKDEYGRPQPDPNYGGQFNNGAIPGVTPEGQVRVRYLELIGKYEDGEKYTIRKPVFDFHNLGYGNLSPNIQVSPRVAQQIPGLGYLEAVDESTILSSADENDADKDGISGKPNYTWDFDKQKKVLGRFGWKANQPSLKQQVAGAFAEDMGITSTVFKGLNFTEAQKEKYSHIQPSSTVDIGDSTLDRVVYYCSTLAVPGRRNVDDPVVKSGKSLFLKAECNKCHIPKMQTGIHKVAQLSNKTIFPFTDLLLHDMGTGLADERPDNEATGQEWRTPPLWGIGQVETVNKHTYFLHDGRARNLEEAILWHGGEAEISRESFKKFTKSDRQALLTFIGSL